MIILAAIIVVLSGATAVFYYGILGGDLPGKSSDVATPGTAKTQTEKTKDTSGAEKKKNSETSQEKTDTKAKDTEKTDTAAQTQKKTDSDKTEESGKTTLKDQTVLTAYLPGGSVTGVKAVGVINGEGVSFRASASAEGEILESLSAGTVVSVTGVQEQWYKVNYKEQSGYISAVYLEPRTQYTFRGNALVLADSLNVRTDPRPSSRMLYQLENGASVDVIGFNNGWFAVSTDWGDGYVSGDYLALGAAKTREKSPVDAQEQAAAISADVGAAIAAKAKELLGSAYSYGGSGPDSFDCSGFTMYVCGLFDIALPHGATSQYKCGTAVSQADLQPGDLVFFSYGSDAIGHVGIYIGDRNFVHASTYDVGVITSSLDGGSYPSRYVGARRMTVS